MEIEETFEFPAPRSPQRVTQSYIQTLILIAGPLLFGNHSRESNEQAS